MRFFVAATLLVGFILSASAQEDLGRVTAFLPQGVVAVLRTQGAALAIHDLTLEVKAGKYSFEVIGSDFEPYSQDVEVLPGADAILLPRLVPSSGFRQSQIDSLRKQKESVRSTQQAFQFAALAGGVAALAGWATVGGLEWVLAAQKSDLASKQSLYEAASASEAPALWAQVEAVKGTIADYRQYETYAIASAGVLSLGTIVLLFAGADSAEYDQRIHILEVGPL